MADKKKKTAPLEEQLLEMQLEDIFLKLNDVVEKLEDREVSLEQSFQYYKDGMTMLQACNEKLDVVEKQMKLIDENGELHEF